MNVSKRAALAVAAFVLAGVLAACGPVVHTNYNYAPPPGDAGKQCVAQCARTQQTCSQTCELTYQSCLAEERDAARRYYRYYVNDRTARKLPVERTMDDYDFDYRCDNKRPETCEAACGSDQRTCYQSCGGTVTGTNVCTAFCDQK